MIERCYALDVDVERFGLTPRFRTHSDGTKDAIAEFEKRSRVIPQLRYELLENLSEKKLALEKRIEATSAPRELARKLALKQSMSRQP